MEAIKVKLFINMSAAILAGRSVSGDAVYVLSDRDLELLTVEERQELARDTDLSRNHMHGGPAAPDLAQADIEGVRAVLQWKIGERARQDAENTENERRAAIERDEIVAFVLDSPIETLVYEDRGLPVVRSWTDHDGSGQWRICWDDPRLKERLQEAKEHVLWLAVTRKERDRLADEALAKRNAEAAQADFLQQARFAAASGEWIRLHGTPNQIRRLDEGLLPEKEIKDEIRTWLFAPLNAMPRFVRLQKADINHDEDCSVHHSRYDSNEVKEMSAEAFEGLSLVRAAVAQIDGAKVEATEHLGWCDECDEEQERAQSRYSAKVTVDWHGCPLSLEYGLPS